MNPEAQTHPAAPRSLLGPLLLSLGLTAGFAAVLPRIPPDYAQAALAVPAVGLNSLLLGLFLLRARRRPEERRGWLLFAASVPVLLAANIIMGLAGQLTRHAGALDWVYLALTVTVGFLQAWGLLALPWRETPDQAPRSLDLSGALLFSASIMLLMWLAGIWQASVPGQAVIHTRILALSIRIALISGAGVYLFSGDPRRLRGPLGWLMGSLAGLGLPVVLLLPLVPGGGFMTRISPWFALAMLAPLGQAFAAWSNQPAEVAPQPPRTRLPLVDLVQVIPFLLAALALGGVLLRHRGPLTGPFLAFLAMTTLLILRQVLTHRQVKAENLLLEHRVVQRTQLMEKMQAVMLRTERMNAMATLGAGLAHDLNNLLGVIQIHTGLLQAEGAEGARNQGFGRILEATEKARQFTNQIMAFGRRQGTRDSEALQPLAEVVQASRPILRMLLPRTIEFQVEVEEAAPAVLVNPLILEQVLVNLLSNAKDAMPEGGMVAVALRAGPGLAAVLEVRDSGPGIPEENQDAIFEPFFTTKPDGKGTGLGLPMVRTIMEANGGTVEVESRPGEGTTFRLTFPGARTPGPSPASAATGGPALAKPAPRDEPRPRTPVPRSTVPRSWPPWLSALVALTLGWAVWVGLGPTRTTLNGTLEIGWPVLLALAATAALGRASRREDLPGAFRTGLRWMTAGLAMVAVGSFHVLFTEVLVPHPMSTIPVGLADLLFMSAYPLIIFGQLRLPRSGPSALGPWRFITDSAVFLFGVGMPLWTLALQPSLGALRGMEAVVGLGFPVLAFTGIIVINAVLLSCAPLPSRRAFNVLMGGLAMSWLADLIFVLHVTERLRIPNLAHLANVVSALALLTITVGAWWLHADPVQARPAKPIPFSPIPLITLGVISVWLVRYLQVFQVTPGTLTTILGGLIVMLFLLLFREGLAARDSYHHAAETVTSALSARFEALVEHSSDLILVTDRDGCLLYASPGVAGFLDVPREAIPGLPLAGFLHPEDLDRWKQFLGALALRSAPRAPVPWRMRNQEGEWRQFEVTGRNLLANPDVAGLVFNARDMTERRDLEGQLYQEMKMGALGRLAGGMAHDFNNLLGAILGNVELARLPAPANEKLLGRLARIEDAAHRMGQLTGRLLSFSNRHSASQTVLSPQQILEDKLARMQDTLGSGIELKVSVGREAGYLEANPEDLEQALLNLLQNARDAMPAGGVARLTFRHAETLDPGQRLYLLPGAGPFLLLELEDTGRGMDGGTLTHLFEPFFSTKDHAKGSGLGLIAVYGFMNACRGGIGIRSTPGQGTVISLWFPQAAPVLAQAARPETAEALQGHETVLLVEDEEAVREAVHELLDSFGYQVFAAEDAPRARTFLETFRGDLDLLVTDVIMPGDSGPKLAAELVQSRPGLRVLYISGYTANELEAHGLAHPGAMLLEKPFTREQLGRRVRESLAH